VYSKQGWKKCEKQGNLKKNSKRANDLWINT
jgi:hypothetical protein